MPPHGRTEALHTFIDDLAAAQIGATFNQYRDSDGDDATLEAPRIRRENLYRYLASRLDCAVLLVAEAAGWRGARYSGLCLYAERQIDETTTPFRRTSRHALGWKEPSATVVQAAIAPWSNHVALWNLLPTHPRRYGLPNSNRAPLLSELRAGATWTHRLIAIVQPRHVAAIGRHAARHLGDDVPAVRHPSHGGALVCASQLRTLLSEWFSAESVG